MASPPPSYRGVSPPPPYESRPGSLDEHPSSLPTCADHPTASSREAIEQDQATKPSHTKLRENTDICPDEPVEASTSKNRLSLVQAYKEKRRAKEAARKVDYYERLYGFVPKNAMTEAEWRDARERVPKTKVPFKPRGKGMTALGLGGMGGI